MAHKHPPFSGGTCRSGTNLQACGSRKGTKESPECALGKVGSLSLEIRSHLGRFVLNASGSQPAGVCLCLL